MENKQRIVLTRLVTGSILFFLVMRFAEQTTLSGLLSPPLFAVDLDFTYWLYKWSGIASLIVQNPTGAILFDILLFATGILSFLFPLQRKWIIPFSILLFLYTLSFNTFATHHLGQVSGFMVVLLPFWVGDNYKFTLAWEGMRYFTCFIYCMAFIWKTFIGNSFYYMQQGVNSFKMNLVDYMFLNPDSFMSSIYRYCLRHEWILNGGEKAVILLEGIMVIGFFTKKYDKALILAPVIIHVTTYFFSDVFFIELLVLDLSFLSIRQLDRLGNWFNPLQELRTRRTGK
jgi:hypothetical protein